MADFFDEVDDMGIVERHIQGVLRLEEDEATKLMRSYSQIRRDLRDRLDRTRADTFTAQQLRGLLAQIEGAIAAMNESLAGNMGASAERAALRGVDDLMREMRTFGKRFPGAVPAIDLNTALIAQDTANFLVNRYEASLNAYGADLLGQISAGITNAAIQGDLDFSEVSDRVAKFFIGEEWKLARIARTELHNVYNLGKQNGMIETRDGFVPDLKKALIHPMDSRTGDDSKFAADLRLVVDIDKPFEYTWKGKKRSFMVPPDRPNDRSILVPYREAWDR